MAQEASWEERTFRQDSKRGGDRSGTEKSNESRESTSARPLRTCETCWNKKLLLRWLETRRRKASTCHSARAAAGAQAAEETLRPGWGQLRPGSSCGLRGLGIGRPRPCGTGPRHRAWGRAMAECDALILNKKSIIH